MTTTTMMMMITAVSSFRRRFSLLSMSLCTSLFLFLFSMHPVPFCLSVPESLSLFLPLLNFFFRASCLPNPSIFSFFLSFIFSIYLCLRYVFLSLSLSLSHTHTHTHTLPLRHSVSLPWPVLHPLQFPTLFLLRPNPLICLKRNAYLPRWKQTRK